MSTDKNTAPANEPKQPYVEPELTKHGTVEEITGNIGSKGSDGLSGSQIV